MHQINTVTRNCNNNSKIHSHSETKYILRKNCTKIGEKIHTYPGISDHTPSYLIVLKIIQQFSNKLQPNKMHASKLSRLFVILLVYSNFQQFMYYRKLHDITSTYFSLSTFFINCWRTFILDKPLIDIDGITEWWHHSNQRSIKSPEGFGSFLLEPVSLLTDIELWLDQGKH